MQTINSRTDLVTYIANNLPDVDEHGLTGSLVEEIQAADHPAWGSDWSEFFESGEFLDLLAEACASPA